MTFQKNNNWCGRGGLAMYCLMVLAASIFALSCGSDETTGAGSAGPVGELMSVTGCKGLSAAKTADTVPPDKDLIEYYYNGNSLFLKHVNAGFNCCSDAYADIAVVGDVITIDEKEGGMFCYCLCLIDLDFRIRNLEPGLYTIRVNELCLHENDQKLEFNVNLFSSPAGSYWVIRDHYPWGQ